MISNDMRIRKKNWQHFWELREGIFGKISSILGAGLNQTYFNLFSRTGTKLKGFISTYLARMLMFPTVTL